ncbi:MAG: dual OB domain-containing protein, partial [bacterium]
GRNDRVPTAVAGQLKDSLRLIRVPALALITYAPGQARGINRRRVQGKFTHEGVTYALRVTDPVIEREYLAMTDGEHGLGDCYLTVSLGEEFEGFCYKLIAAIITR